MTSVKCVYNPIWLVNSSLSFYLISLQRDFLILKKVVSGKNSFIFRFFLRHNCNKSLCKNIFLMSSHSCASTFARATTQYTDLPSPTTCMVEDFRRLRFVNIQSHKKFTGKPRIVSHPKSSQESLKHKSIFMFITRTIHPSTISMAQPDISPGSKNTHIRLSINEGF